MAIPSKIRVGTRGSALALWQTEFVISKLRQELPLSEFEIVKIKTSSDQNQTADITELGGKGVFIKEIEDAILSDQIDIAVHSMKDLSSVPPNGLVYAAYVGGEHRGDVFVAPSGRKFDELGKGVSVGCGSLRRQEQLKMLIDDLEFIPIRGNIETRIAKMDRGVVDTLVLAEAGLRRLGLHNRITYVFNQDEMVSAGGQGIIVVESRVDSEDLNTHIERISDINAQFAGRIEFEFLALIGAGCQTPVGIYASKDHDKILTYMFLKLEDKDFIIKQKKEFRINDQNEIAKILAETVQKEYKEKTGEQMALQS